MIRDILKPKSEKEIRQQINDYPVRNLLDLYYIKKTEIDKYISGWKKIKLKIAENWLLLIYVIFSVSAITLFIIALFFEIFK
jgi:hypothetical protein